MRQKVKVSVAKKNHEPVCMRYRYYRLSVSTGKGDDDYRSVPVKGGDRETTKTTFELHRVE
jgi:hypothetical protein